MSIPKTIFQLGFAFILSAALIVSGCAEPAAEKETVSKSEPPVETASFAEEVQEAPETHELVGVWWGKGAINEASLAMAIEGLSPETQRQVKTAAETFLATEMAIEFKADGNMETAVEVTDQSGQRESGTSIATWEADPTTTRGEYRVSSVETQDNGMKVSGYKTYRVSADGRKLVLLVDLPGLLGQCSPQIVLDRQGGAESVANEQETLLR